MVFFLLFSGPGIFVNFLPIMLIMVTNAMCRLQDHNMTGKDAYKYFVLRAQEIAISLNWTPVNW